uniref:Uncharacterized protein n=1 Tax=Tanacetum cinerariifolium TaxID=118510 RepID=A0A6L2N3M0_TANCI|nr:hypothetical protein [Tanacetum cinerariifolium]
MYGTNALSKFSPDIELILYPFQDKLTSEDKSLDLSAFKLSRLFFSLLSSGSSSCWRSYGAQLHDSNTTAKELVCKSVTPRSLPQDNYSTPVKDYVCESATPRCMPHDLNVSQMETQVEVLVSKEADVGRTKVNGQEAVEALSDG